jgi:hypothetical protein
MRSKAAAFGLVMLVGVLVAIGVTRGNAPPPPATVQELFHDLNNPALHRSYVVLQGHHTVVPSDYDDLGISPEPLRFPLPEGANIEVCGGAFAGRAPQAQLYCPPQALPPVEGTEVQCTPPSHDHMTRAELRRQICTATIPAGVHVYRLRLRPGQRYGTTGPDSHPLSVRPWTFLVYFRDRRILLEDGAASGDHYQNFFDL